MTAAVIDGGARLDVELVRRGLARSRQRAVELVAGGRVLVGGVVAHKPSQTVRPGDDVFVDGGPEYVSRAARKLLGALDDVTELAPGHLDVRGARCLDAGASTGGFTEVLLERGAAHVVAVDVGHDQLAAGLRADPRVTVVEGCNVRDLDRLEAGVLRAPVDVVVADLSFISLTLVAGPLLRAARPGADLLLMVKPQFEVGRERLPAGGVVIDEAHQVDAVVAVAVAVRRAGGDVLAVLPSVLPGESGNREFFLWVRAGGTAPPPEEDRAATGTDGAAAGDPVRTAVAAAVARGVPVLVDVTRGDAP